MDRPKLLLDNPEGLKYEYIMTFLGYSPSTPEEIAQCFQVFGDTPYGFQMVGRAPNGFFEGPKLKGIVLEGADWMTIRKSDGVALVNARNTLKTDDGEMIYMHYEGFIYGPNDFINRWMYQGEMMDPSEYYFRTAPRFTAKMDGKYAWLNNLITVGVGKTDARGGYYDIYAIL